MFWRRAESLWVLEREIQSRWFNTTVWSIGDPAHAATWSDHNPNKLGVVCAIDVLGNAGLDLHWFSRRIVATNPPALKYVIYNKQIWLPGLGWQPYYGSNPHTTHVHVSVGWGPDGRSTGPYDDTNSWGIREDDDFMSALSDKEQKELYALIKAMRKESSANTARVEAALKLNSSIKTAWSTQNPKGVESLALVDLLKQLGAEKLDYELLADLLADALLRKIVSDKS